jgi:RNA polymerase sigma factor (sigma-70 family)
MNRSTAGAEQTEQLSDALSPREQEIVVLVARGASNKEVARLLGLSEGTVKVHLHNIFRKVGATTRYNLIAATRD